MKFQTLSVVVGNAACNARCPFCVSKMTGLEQVSGRPALNVRNMRKAIALAKTGGVTTVIITGKGEPLLYPAEVLEVAYKCQDFPFVELQTNGRVFQDEMIRRDSNDTLLKAYCLEHKTEVTVDKYLGGLYNAGVTSILLSNVGPDQELNRSIYFPGDETYNIEKIVEKIQSKGLMVRLTTVGIKGGVDSPEKIIELIDFAKRLGVKQITWRPVAASGNGKQAQWANENRIECPEGVVAQIRNEGTLIYRLMHGAAVYDFNGINICISDCLTRGETAEDIRQLIVYPDGSLYTDWELKGSILLDGGNKNV